MRSTSVLLGLLRNHLRPLSANGALDGCCCSSSGSSSAVHWWSCRMQTTSRMELSSSTSTSGGGTSSSSSTTTSSSSRYTPQLQPWRARGPAAAVGPPSQLLQQTHQRPHPQQHHQQQQQRRGLATHVAFDSIGIPLSSSSSSQADPQAHQYGGPQLVVQQLPSPPRPRAQAFKVPVYACHLGYELDYQAFCVDVKFKSRSMGRDNALLEIEGELSEESVLLGAEREERPEKIMLIYRYGSVLFFNMRERERTLWLSRLQPYVKLPASSGNSDSALQGVAAKPEAPPLALRHDETLVVVRPDLTTWSTLEPDKIVVQALSVGNVRVIGHVLGQSVALDYYNSKVDEAIQLFTPYLKSVASTGCMDITEANLLKLIAENSLLYTDVVTKIGLLDISQTAWMQDRYHELWQSLRTDYEIDRRFDAINRKLGPMLENAKFLLDIRAERKSVQAEWIIIGLICVEVAVNFYGHFFLTG